MAGLKPAACSCGGLAAGSGGNLAPPPNLTIRPCPPVPFDAHGWPFAGLGRCCSLAARGYPCSHPASCWAMLVGELAEQPEVPRPWWPRAGGGHGEGRVVDSPLRPCRPEACSGLTCPHDFPLPSHLYIEEVDIWHWAWDA